MEDYPTSENFDYLERIASGNVPKKGKKLILHISSSEQLNATIMKSDTATVLIPDLELEEAPGTGRYITISDLMQEMRDKISSSIGYFPSGSIQRANAENFLKLMYLMVTGEQPFELIVDDPLASSYVKKAADYSIRIEEEEYERTWDQNEELGILEAVEDNEYEDENEAVAKLVELINNSKQIVALTGAGVSVESGIPAFRGGDDSIWSKYDPADSTYQNFVSSEKSRNNHWKLKTEFYEYVLKAKPNPSHTIFSLLNDRNKLLAIITQNIDDLHEEGGVPASKIVRLHGKENAVACLNCKKSYDRGEIHKKILNGEKVPDCECGGILKGGTVFFGEALDHQYLETARDYLKKCDLLLVMGTSLRVQPANKLPTVCLERKVPVVIINKDGDTPYDNFATLLIHSASGAIMSAVRDKL